MTAILVYQVAQRNMGCNCLTGLRLWSPLYCNPRVGVMRDEGLLEKIRSSWMEILETYLGKSWLSPKDLMVRKKLG